MKYYNLTNTKDSLYLQEQAVHARQCSFNFFKDNQTTIEIHWRCKDILADTHDRRQTIDVTAYVRQFENTSARYEQSPVEVISNVLTDIKRDAINISKNLHRISIDLSESRRNAQEDNDEQRRRRPRLEQR